MPSLLLSWSSSSWSSWSLSKRILDHMVTSPVKKNYHHHLDHNHHWRNHLNDRIVTSPVSVSEKCEKTGARLRLSNLWGWKALKRLFGIINIIIDQICKNNHIFLFWLSPEVPEKNICRNVGPTNRPPLWAPRTKWISGTGRKTIHAVKEN